MAGQNPGVWIGAAIALAVVIVAVSVPNKPSSPPPKEGRGATAPPPSSRPSVSTTPRVADAPTVPPPATPSAPSGNASPPTAPSVVVSPVPAPTIAPDRVLPPPANAGDALPSPPRIVPRNEAVQAVDNVHFALRDYRSALGENPEGSNEEITKALLGDNLKQVRVNMPEGSQVSKGGELCDPWGTPYFFHQLSKQKMEIRSAGPDLKMWTNDDIQM